jgi:hypothetical protein
MRRPLVYLLLITGLLAIIIGIAEAVVHPAQLPKAHITVSSIFAILCIVHIVINRKAVMKYIKGK